MLAPVAIIVFHHIIPEQPYSPSVLIHFHKQIKAECQWRYAPLLSIPASVRINKQSSQSGAGASHSLVLLLTVSKVWVVCQGSCEIHVVRTKHTKDRALKPQDGCTEQGVLAIITFTHSKHFPNNIFSVHKSQVVFVFRDLPKLGISSLLKPVFEQNNTQEISNFR